VLGEEREDVGPAETGVGRPVLECEEKTEVEVEPAEEGADPGRPLGRMIGRKSEWESEGALTRGGGIGRAGGMY